MLPPSNNSGGNTKKQGPTTMPFPTLDEIGSFEALYRCMEIGFASGPGFVHREEAARDKASEWYNWRAGYSNRWQEYSIAYEAMLLRQAADNAANATIFSACKAAVR